MISEYGFAPKSAEQLQKEMIAQFAILDTGEKRKSDALVDKVDNTLKNEDITKLFYGVKANTVSKDILRSINKMKDKSYNLGSKDGNSIDCSGFTYKVLTDMGKNIPTNDLSSQGIWANSKEQKTYKDWKSIKQENLKEGMIIAFDTGDYEFDKNRKYGIDHIGVIVFDSKGNPMIAESATSKKGVAITPYAQRLEELGKILKTVYTGIY